MTHRLTPIEEPFSSEISGLLANYPRREGYLLTLFRVFANSSRFLKKGVANLLDRDSPLTMRQRELTILRVTANCRCEYEWGVHVAGFADHVGFSSEQIEATCAADVAPCWNPTESLLIRVVDELCEHNRLSEALQESFERCFSVAEQLEILALVGNYHTVSFVANTARLKPESFAARFPTAEAVAACRY